MATAGGIRLPLGGPAQPGLRSAVGCGVSWTEYGRALGQGSTVRLGCRRRGPRRELEVGGGAEPEMGEDLANDAGILNGRDQMHAAARTCCVRFLSA